MSFNSLVESTSSVFDELNATEKASSLSIDTNFSNSKSLNNINSLKEKKSSKYQSSLNCNDISYNESNKFLNISNDNYNKLILPDIHNNSKIDVLENAKKSIEYNTNKCDKALSILSYKHNNIINNKSNIKENKTNFGSMLNEIYKNRKQNSINNTLYKSNTIQNNSYINKNINFNVLSSNNLNNDSNVYNMLDYSNKLLNDNFKKLFKNIDIFNMFIVPYISKECNLSLELKIDISYLSQYLFVSNYKLIKNLDKSNNKNTSFKSNIIYYL